MAIGKKVLLLLVVIAIIATAYYFYKTPTQTITPTEKTLLTELTELKKVFNNNGLEMESFLAVNKDFYALNNQKLASFKAGLESFSSSAKTDAKQLANNFSLLVDYATERNNFNQKVEQINAIDQNDYCKNIQLFESRDSIGATMNQTLSSFQTRFNNFIEANQSELASFSSLEKIDLDLDSGKENQTNRETATELLKQSCQGETQ